MRTAIHFALQQAQEFARAKKRGRWGGLPGPRRLHPAAAFLFLASLLLCFPAWLLATTVTGTVKDASGTNVPESSRVIFRLSQEGTVSDPALLLIQPPVTCTITAGAVQTTPACIVRGNDTISPAGTFYRLRIIGPNGQELLPERRYTITGATFDLGTATPLASDTIAATAYQIVQDEATNLVQQIRLNFTGAGVSCSNDATNSRTNCSITGGGAGSTHQIDGVNLTSQDPINFLDTGEFDWTNPSAGNLSLALKASSVAASKLDDGGAAATFAIFSGAAGPASFRALAAGDFPAGYIDALTDFAGALCGTNQILEDQGASWACINTPSGGAAHTILSATHSDTLAASVVLGDIMAGNSTPAWQRVAGNTTATKNFLTQTGNGTISALPVWGTIADGDIPATLTRDSEINVQGTANQIASTGAGVAPVLSITNPFVFPGKATLAASVAGAASANLPNGAAPSTPSAGDLWAESSQPKFRLTASTTDLVLGTRSVNTTAPLGGGGALSGDLTLTCTGCLTSVTPHAILSATHSDTTAAAVVRGDLMAGIGVSPKWERLATGASGTVLHGGTEPSYSAVSLTADVSGILPGANGGTNNAFFQVTGPATPLKTFTFPNASATVLTSNAAVTVTQGGTGAAPGADDQALISDSTSAATWRAIPNCNTENMLTYATATNTFGCESDTTGGAGGGYDSLKGDTGTASKTGTEAAKIQGTSGEIATVAADASPDDTVTLSLPATLSTVKTVSAAWLFTGIPAFRKDNILTTPTDAALVENTTASTAVNPLQYSPAVRWIGHAWNTGGTPADNAVEYRLFVVPTSGNPPTFKLSFQKSINAGAFSEQASVSDGGVFDVAAGFRIGGAAASGARLRGNGTNFVSDATSLSGVGACGANTFASTLNNEAAPTCTQPSFSNLSGSATLAQLPFGTANQLIKTNAGATAQEHATLSGVANETDVTFGAGTISIGIVDPLAGSKGGTNNAFMEFTGPATTLKIFTLPNASTTILTTNAAVTPAQGGTGDDTSATTGVPRIAAGNWTYDAGVSHLASSSSADLRGALSDETGTGVAVFSSPTTFTLDVEAGTNSVTTVSKFMLFEPGCEGGTASLGGNTPVGTGDTAPTAACNDTGSIQRPSADFSGSAVNSFERTFKLPSDWAGNIDLAIRYVTVAASPTGNAEWDISTVCRAVGESWDAAFNTAQTITDAVGAQNALNDATQTSLTITGCAAGEDLTIKVSRDGTSDTNNDLAKMLHAEVTLRRAQ